MHAYITDSSERVKVPLMLAALSLALSWGLYRGLRLTEISLPWWLGAPSMAGFYALLYQGFDRLFWRWRAIRWAMGVRVPILAGDWRGYVLSSYDDYRVKHQVSAEIRQRWTQMEIILQGEYSRSHSFVAAIFVDAPGGVVLDHEYQNDPIPEAKDSLQIHYGTARLLLVGANVLDGFYYTGKGRGNDGRLHLSRAAAPRVGFQ